MYKPGKRGRANDVIILPAHNEHDSFFEEEPDDIAFSNSTTVDEPEMTAAQEEDLHSFIEENKPNLGGRPTAYDSMNYPRMAFIACSELGAKDKDLAKLFEVHPDIITLWKRTHRGFHLSIIHGRDLWNTNAIEQAPLKKLIFGYHYTETKVEDIFIGASQMPATRRTTTRKYIPPVPRTLEWFLSNRDKSRWKNPRTFEIKGDPIPDYYSMGPNGEKKIDFEKLGKEEALNLRDIIQGAITSSTDDR